MLLLAVGIEDDFNGAILGVNQDHAVFDVVYNQDQRVEINAVVFAGNTPGAGPMTLNDVGANNQMVAAGFGFEALPCRRW